MAALHSAHHISFFAKRWLGHNHKTSMAPDNAARNNFFGGGAETQYMSTYNREIGMRRSPPALGASGSVNASVIFNILYSPYSTVLIYGIVPMPAWALGGLWLAYDVSGAMVGSDCDLSPPLKYSNYGILSEPLHACIVRSISAADTRLTQPTHMQAYRPCLHSLRSRCMWTLSHVLLVSNLLYLSI